MPLPAGQLARDTFDYNGSPVAIQSMTRAQAFYIREIQSDLDEVEIYVLMCGTASTREEVVAFRGSEGDSARLNLLLEAIGKLSGIKLEVSENGDSPKAP